MRPIDLNLEDPAPQRALVTSRAETYDAVLLAVGSAKRMLRCLHLDLSLFDLASTEAIERMAALLLAHRSARVRLLVDDATWLDMRAARLRALQQRFPHALELRIASH